LQQLASGNISGSACKLAEVLLEEIAKVSGLAISRLTKVIKYNGLAVSELTKKFAG
jgi:hypothetical protein